MTLSRAELDMIAEKAKTAGVELYHENKKSISGLRGGDLYNRAIDMKDDLFELSWMSMAVSLSQSALMVGTSHDNAEKLADPGFVGTVFYLCGYGGLALEVLGALFSVIYAHYTLRQTAALIQQVESNVCGPVWWGHREYCVPSCSLPGRLPNDLRRLLDTLDHHSNVLFGFPVVFHAGLLLNVLMVSIFLIADAERLVDWVLVMVVMAVMTTALLSTSFLCVRFNRTFYRAFYLYLVG